jgi:eukaryotic-like serine/threonine-protein kinase
MPAPSEPILNTCPECSGIIDVSAVRPYEKIACPHCDHAVRVRIMFGKFTILAEIGEGGMSRVFRAHDATLGREVALKVLHSHFGDHAELIAQFEKEARLTASINHANVVQVYSVGRDQGYFYIAMELLQPESLDAKLSRGRITEAMALRLIHEVAQGLASAHKVGLIHRDIKPGNVLFDRSGTAKLVDFGLALAMDDEEDMADIWATPHYVPPEKLQGQPDDLRGDIYSLGATLYHILAGEPPHQVDTISTGELLRIKSQPANLRAAAPKLKSRTIQLVNKMMAFEPKDRFASYPDLIRAIEETRAAADPTFVLPGGPKKSPVWLQLTLGITGGLIVVGALATLVIPRGASKEKPKAAPAPGLRSASEEVVVSGADTARLQRIDLARKRYAAGKTAEALALFTEAEADPKLRADLRAWGAFHLGIEAALKGDALEAKRFYAAAAEYGKGASPAEAGWFASLQDWSFAPEDPLGALVIGCEALTAGNYPKAAQNLAKYAGTKFSGEESWKGIYQPAASLGKNDAELLSKAPDAETSGDLPSLQKALDAWSGLVGKLRYEKSRQFAQGKITTLGGAIVQAELKVQLAARQGDIARFLETEASAADLLKARNFSGAAQLWAALELTSDWGKKRAANAAEAYARAGAFVADFTSLIGKYGYSGQILRTSGPPFAARVVSGTPDKLIVDLGFGPTPIALDAISSVGLLTIAKSTFLPEAPPALQERAAFFAWLIGDQAYAKELSRELHEVPGFVDRWEAIAVSPETP